MLQTLCNGQGAPLGGGLLFGLSGIAIGLSGFQKALCGILAAIEDHILDQLTQLGFDLVIDLKLAGIDDAHIHARLDGMVEKHRVHGLAHRLIAAERE